MTLFVVSTPIGNLEDMTFRAIRILKEVKLILTEDTRRTSILLKHYGISNRMESFNEHTLGKMSWIIEALKTQDIAIVSDAGTPGISDPGFDLVRECVRNNISVSPVPGASAVISAVSCSGLPTDRFEFYGFLPKKEKKIVDVISQIKATAVFYESPYRIVKTLKIISEKYPESKVVVARELTKKFEEFVRGTAKEVYSKFENRVVKGEIVLLISNKAN